MASDLCRVCLFCCISECGSGCRLSCGTSVRLASFRFIFWVWRSLFFLSFFRARGFIEVRASGNQPRPESAATGGRGPCLKGTFSQRSFCTRMQLRVQDPKLECILNDASTRVLGNSELQTFSPDLSALGLLNPKP